MDWLKAFHMVFVVSWFAGLFYLPRLFVYHADTHDQLGFDRFCIMERRLSILTSIAAAGTIIFGAWLALLKGGDWISANGWFHAKLALVLVLIGFQGWCQIQVKKFRERRNRLSADTFRTTNEIPTVVLVLIMIVIFVKPF
ncbi:CopD family protein [Salinisphaera sp. USBA-960]|uniref:CopD family protein n=1 Tax=Salinisphaera orenii TaxID=856731 RepID=UPI000DBE03D4|nr:CopD family protein [Salifodinibacter halophilus]NNC25375.1 CopD family protein [Salifodinibacter halophilus]